MLMDEIKLAESVAWWNGFHCGLRLGMIAGLAITLLAYWVLL